MAHHIIKTVTFDIDALTLEAVAIDSDDEHQQEQAETTTGTLTAHDFCDGAEQHEASASCADENRQRALAGILRTISSSELSQAVEERFLASLFIATRTHEPNFGRLTGRPFWDYTQPGRELDAEQEAEFAAAFERTYRNWDNASDGEEEQR